MSHIFFVLFFHLDRRTSLTTNYRLDIIEIEEGRREWSCEAEEESMVAYIGNALDQGHIRVAERNAIETAAAAHDCRAGFVWVVPSHSLCYGAVAEEDITPSFFVDFLFVAPVHRRAGVGRYLMNGVMAAASAAGVPTVWLDIWRNNPVSMRFFTGYGFQEQVVMHRKCL
jgi:GNAT superfamily N-acetyltransferase